MISGIHNFITENGETVTIQRNAPTENNLGGFKDNWSNHIVDLNALIRPVSGSESKTGNKLSYIASHTMYCSAEDIREDDRVIDSEGDIYMIRDVNNPMNFDNHLQITLEIIK